MAGKSVSPFTAHIRSIVSAQTSASSKVLKDTLELLPVYHWTEDRIRAYVFICVIAWQLERWMRNKLKEMAVTVPTAIRLLRQIKMEEIMPGEQKLMTPCRPTDMQRKIQRALGAPPIPTNGEQANNHELMHGYFHSFQPKTMH